MSVNERDNSGRDVGPWYKQFWAWFILTPLIVVILAWIPFMTIVLKSADDVVIDNYYKEGRMYNLRVDEDRWAQELGLNGELFVDPDVGDVVLSVAKKNSEYQFPEAIVVNFDHPVEADNDLAITLRQSSLPGRYQGEMPRRLRNHWYVRLYPLVVNDSVIETESGPKAAVKNWRIVGEMDFNQGSRMQFGVSE